MIIPASLRSVFLCILAVGSLPAATLVIQSGVRDGSGVVTDGDTYIRSSTTGQNSNFGADTLALIGDTTTSGDYLRGLFAFNLSAPELVGATINSVTLTLTIANTDSSGSQNALVGLSLYQIGAYTTSSVTWNNAPSIAGGSLTNELATTSANAATVGTGSTLNFTSSALATAVGNSVSGSFYLLAKLTTEDNANRNIFRVISINSTAGTQGTAYPALTIDYTPIPEPSTAALLGGLAVLGLAACRRRASR